MVLLVKLNQFSMLGTVMIIWLQLFSSACSIISFTNSPVCPLTICTFFCPNTNVHFTSSMNFPSLSSVECVSWNRFSSLVPLVHYWMVIFLLLFDSLFPCWHILLQCLFLIVSSSCLTPLFCCHHNDYLLLNLITMMFCRLLALYLHHWIVYCICYWLGLIGLCHRRFSIIDQPLWSFMHPILYLWICFGWDYQCWY